MQVLDGDIEVYHRYGAHGSLFGWGYITVRRKITMLVVERRYVAPQGNIIQILGLRLANMQTCSIGCGSLHKRDVVLPLSSSNLLQGLVPWYDVNKQMITSQCFQHQLDFLVS